MLGAPFSETQMSFMANCDKKINLASGSIRSGKTVSSLFAFLMALANAPSRGEIVIIGRTSNTVYRNIFGPLKDVELFGKYAKGVHFSRGAQTGKILGREVHVIGASDSASEERIRGMTVALALVDEATLLPENFWLQLIGRLSHPDSKVIATTNPDNPNHWMKKDFLDRNDPEFFHVHFTIDDNPSLDPKTVAFWKRQYSGLFYQRFIDGLWVAAEGAIYDSFDESIHVVDELPEMARCLAVGVDYGTVDAFSAQVLQLGVDQKLYFTHEHFYNYKDNASRQKKNESDHSKDLRSFLRDNELYPMYIYVDPSASGFRETLRRENMRGGIRLAKNKVIPGIRTMSSLLSDRNIYIHRSCKNLIRELPAYSWDSKYQLLGQDKPVDGNDHALDSARYVVYSTRRMWQTRLGLPQDVDDDE